jgi:hypothetical protein
VQKEKTKEKHENMKLMVAVKIPSPIIFYSLMRSQYNIQTPEHLKASLTS